MSIAPTHAPAIEHLDLDSVGGNLCHTAHADGRTYCGMGDNGPPSHDWIEPQDGICPSCGKRSCPTCDLLCEIRWWLS